MGGQTREVGSGTVKVIIGAVVGFFALVGGGAYYWDEHTHGPFSGDAYLGRGLTEAKGLASDAALMRVSATYVNENGELQAAFSEGSHWKNAGYLVLDFASASHGSAAPPPTTVPLGAPVPDADARAAVKSRCQRLHLSTGLHGSGKQTTFETRTSWVDDPKCTAPLPAPLRCSLAAIWKRAIADGAPHPAFANITLVPTGSSNTWSFEIVDHSKGGAVAFGRSYPDDC